MRITHTKNGGLHFFQIGNIGGFIVYRKKRQPRRIDEIRAERQKSPLILRTGLALILILPFAFLLGVKLGEMLAG